MDVLIFYGSMARLCSSSLLWHAGEILVSSSTALEYA